MTPAAKNENAAPSSNEADLAKRVEELAAELEKTKAGAFASLPSIVKDDPATIAAEKAEAQKILDAIAGGRGGVLSDLRPTRDEVRDAIKTVERHERARIAGLRGIDPEDEAAIRGTHTNGLREHVRNLRECAEIYFEREDI